MEIEAISKDGVNSKPQGNEIIKQCVILYV